MAQASRYRLWRAHLTPSVDDDLPWLLAAGVAVGLVYLAYLTTHTHPAYEGGLFIDIAEQIRLHGYGLPERIPGYTAEGVPFAYPPLTFYALTVVVDLTGADPVTLLLVVPGLVVAASLVPYYYTAKALLGSSQQAGLATVVFAVTPAALRWHLSAGGIVRGPAMLFALTGAYVGVRLFRDRDRRWLGPAVALFGLTVLSHPHYTVFFAVTYLLLFATYDWTRQGLLAGALVAGGGLALATPWWTQVVATHGPDVFIAASGSHHGLLGGVGRLKRQFVYPVKAAGPLTPFYLAAYAGGAYAVVRRRFVLAAWMVVPSYVVGKNRFLFVAGAMLIGLVVWEVFVPAARRITASPGDSFTLDDWGAGSTPGVGSPDRRDLLATVSVVGLVVLVAAGIGVLFAGSGLATAHHHSTSLPQTVDGDDREAMTWVATNTPEDARVLVLGDAAEWYPSYTDRTIVVSPWGNEWRSTERYYDELALYLDLSTCHGPTCLSSGLADTDRDPEYVAVPVGEYTVRGKEHRNEEWVVDEFATADEYRLVHENGGVAVFRVTAGLDSWEPPEVPDGLGPTERPVAALS